MGQERQARGPEKKSSSERLPSPSKIKTLKVRVAEAESKDVGRGIARLDPSDMVKIDATIGDVITLQSQRGTTVGVAKLMPTYLETRSKKVVQVDGIIRDTAKVSIDQQVAIAKTSFCEASRVVLKPLQLASVGVSGSEEYLSRLFAGIPVVKGGKVRAILFGSRFRDFEVVKTTPEGGVVLITPQTEIVIESSDRPVSEERRPEIAYEDIGGLDKAIQRIREMVELPLKFPQVFQRLGIDPPKGVLLYGPPGTGKTLIARAVAHESDAAFYTVNGPEIIHKFYGESEAHLRSIFEKATADAPAIIFIDEIDAIAPKRAEVTGEVEKRVVATLLAMMDGLQSRGQVIVMGATNIPDVMDPALRRPGRFDREVRIGIPDRTARKTILDIHTRGMPLAKDVDLQKLADITHGYVGADLEALAREAGMNCLRKVFTEEEVPLDQIPADRLLNLNVTADDFLEALKDIEPSALREIAIEVPEVRWEDIGGLEKIKQVLKEAVAWPLKHQKLFEEAKLSPSKGVLLEGPPGTGKTLIAKALAHESDVNFISIKGPELMNKYVGEAEKGVRKIFQMAKAASPCIVFFDELDGLIPTRASATGDSGVTQRVISQFLTEMDGIEELKGVFVLAATNRKELIDPALLRTGRFDFILSVPKPDEVTRQNIFEIHTRGKPLAKDVDFRKLAKATEEQVGSDIEAVCRQASMASIRDVIYKKSKKLQVTMAHFQEALKGVKGGE